MEETIKSDKGFYIGDICYVLDNKLYDEVWGKVYKYKKGKITDPKSGLSFAVSSTAYGDGDYYDKNGREYCVDAGVIGIVPIELICDYYDCGGHIFEGGGEAVFEEENGIFEIILPNGKVINIDTTEEY